MTVDTPAAESPLLRHVFKNRSRYIEVPIGTVEIPCYRESSHATRVQKQVRIHRGAHRDRGHPLLQRVLFCDKRPKQ